jgi:V/A-type H+-transporting ATPase subunit D
VNPVRRTAPTRHNLMRVRRRLERVRTAAELLTRRRSALVNELFRAARPVVESREAIAWQAAVSYAALVQAQADRGHPLLAALALPMREIGVELRSAEGFGLTGAELVAHDPIRREAHERGVSVGAAGPAAAATAEQFERLSTLILDSVSQELRIRRLARALAETSRRVNVLERRVGPGLAGETRRIGATLEEREREEQLRYRHLLEGIGRIGGVFRRSGR